MAFFKWFAKIDKAQAVDAQQPKAPLEPFDYESLRPNGIGQRIKAKLATIFTFRILPPALRLLQNIRPVIHIRALKLAIVTRDEYVRQVLGDSATFSVPYGDEMQELGAGTTFLLGQDGAGHDRLNAILRDVIRPSDMEQFIEQTRRFSEGLIENGGGRIDVVGDLITRVATETGARFCGIEIEDPRTFAQWSFAVSGLLFGDPGGDPATRKLAINGARRLCLAIDRSIRRSHERGEKRGDSMLDRLVARGDVSDEDIRATLLGTITGFIPTNSLAASKMLAELIRRPRPLAEAQRRAAANDRDGVRAIIMEAGRMNSALAPGLWRVVRNDAVIASGSAHERKIPAGTIVLASTMTALRDKRRFASPNAFRTDREVEGDLMFGAGPHACLGKYMAIEQITEIFMVLLAQPELQCAQGKLGKMDSIGAFPVRLDMTYRSDASEQNMIMVVATVTSGISKALLDKQIKALGHPATDTIRAGLDATGLVHFSSIATVQSDKHLQLLMELSIDGPVEPAVAAIARGVGDHLRPIFAHAGLDPNADLADYLNAHVIRLHSRPWGPTGLDFNGTGEFPVGLIDRQEKLAALTEDIIQEHLARNANDGSRAMRMLNHVRAVLNQDTYLRKTADVESDLMDATMLGAMDEAERQSLDAFIMKPSRKRLELAAYRDPGKMRAFVKYLLSRHATIFTVPVLLLFLVSLNRTWSLLNPPSFFVDGCALRWTRLLPHFERCHLGWPQSGWAVLQGTEAIFWSLLGTVLLLGLIAGALLLLLRYKEARDEVDETRATLGHMQAITQIEDHPGYAQNHIMAVGTLKDGFFRKLVHAFALWAIKMVVVFYYRTGFIIDMGTIHYARWMRLPGTNRTVFYSNYNGSWESYLEDFITRARWGQTAVWSNWKGFPKSRFLAWRGAQDGDQFKRWVRCKQEIVPFWYSRFPHLTTDQIRNNAMIHHGLARARNDNEARDWLRFFGSMPKVHNRVETDEVQTLVFSGMGRYQYSSYLMINFPKERNLRTLWLNLILGQTVKLNTAGFTKDILEVVDPASFEKYELKSNERREMVTCSLKSEYAMTFGDHRSKVPEEAAEATKLFLSLSARGMEQCHKKFSGFESEELELPTGFSSPYEMGMASRGNILGDNQLSHSINWEWSDQRTSHYNESSDAVMIIYGASANSLDKMVKFHHNLLNFFGGELNDSVDSYPSEYGFGFEHFGFRDGISQPAMAGTSTVKAGSVARDVVEPGEFILGYQNSEGFFAPSPLVRSEADPQNILPLKASTELSRFPDFGEARPSDFLRDFGRNGTYLVIRELSQDVVAFNRHLEHLESKLFAKRLHDFDACVSPISEGFDNIEKLIGRPPSREWIAAKMMGRWQDGRPLIGNEANPFQEALRMKNVPPTPEELFNDFSYGSDDPQGLACPFGAHIRRANPRDSKQPGDPVEQDITNRHRLLRRGRTYERPDKLDARGEPEKGIMFVCLCADIERQFEFVQQTWLNSSGFHGLNNEPDPIVGTRTKDSRFTIPTTAGPIRIKTDDTAGIEQFVTVRGGGYFFLPSRSALLFLASG